MFIFSLIWAIPSNTRNIPSVSWQYLSNPGITLQYLAKSGITRQYMTRLTIAKQYLPFPKIPNNTKQYQTIPNNTKQCQKIENNNLITKNLVLFGIGGISNVSSIITNAIFRKPLTLT